MQIHKSQILYALLSNLGLLNDDLADMQDRAGRKE